MGLIHTLILPVPLSFLSEEPLESHNKIAKYNRGHHIMSINRTEDMKQWILRSIDCSDPLVLQKSQSHRLKMRKVFPFDSLPEVVKDMVIVDHPYNKFHL